MLSCVELEPGTEARNVIIWLHGLGADGHDFVPIVPYLRVQDPLAVRFVFPHAPRRPVTVNMGMVMPAWYDIRALDPPQHDLEGAEESCRQVRELIERELDRGIPAERIVLAGFSQGGAIALQLGLRFEQRLAGIIALSTYLLQPDQLADERHDCGAGLAIFQAHGEGDPMVPLSIGQSARDRLQELGYELEWHSYAMGHELHPQEIRDIASWLEARLT